MIIVADVKLSGEPLRLSRFPRQSATDISGVTRVLDDRGRSYEVRPPPDFLGGGRRTGPKRKMLSNG